MADNSSCLTNLSGDSDRMDNTVPAEIIEGAQAKIDAFVSRWVKDLWPYCKTNNQKQACWYLWIRYSLSLRSLRHLAAANDICGCYTIARCCIEYDVAISAIAKKPELGDDYMGYEVHAKSRHLQSMRHHEPSWKIDELEKYMASQFGPDFARSKKPNWHGGFPTLCVVAGCEDVLSMYHILCQFVHGTVTGMKALNTLGMMGEQHSGTTLMNLLTIHTLSFLQITRRVLDVLFPLWTQVKDDCEKELKSLAESVVGLS